jgi:hypothetical protein
MRAKHRTIRRDHDQRALRMAQRRSGAVAPFGDVSEDQ